MRRLDPIGLLLGAAALPCLLLILLALVRSERALEFAGVRLDASDLRGAMFGVALVAAVASLRFRVPLREWLVGLAAGGPGGASNRGTAAMVLALTAAGFALRIAEIHEYGLSSDESQFVWFAAAENLSDLWRYESTTSPHPPMMFLMLHAIQEFTREIVWLRLPSVLAGTLTIWLAWRFGRELMGPAEGLVLAWLVAFSPSLVELSRVARNYAPGFAFMLLAVLLLARFLRREDWRALAAFGVVSAFAFSWHYVFVGVFGALGLVLGAVLLWRRSPFASWRRAALLNLPLAVVAGSLYWFHLSQLPYLELHLGAYEAMLSIDPAQFARPLFELCQLLGPPRLAGLLLALAVSGGVVLWLRGRRLALLFLVAPLALAYLLSAAGRLPLGGTRHSSYLFPFLFGLVAATVPELLDGCHRLARRFGARAADVGLQARAIVGALVVVVGLASFAAQSLLDHTTPKPQYTPGALAEFLPVAGLSQYGRELIQHYRQRDVERAFEIIDERATDRDAVLFGKVNVFALLLHFELRPVLSPTARQEQRRDIRWITAPGPRRMRREGIRFYFSPAIVFTTPQHLRLGLDQISDVFKLRKIERVWVMLSGWDAHLPRWLEVDYPWIQFDRDLLHESNGRLFVIDADELRKVR